ncbi:MAG: acyl carrier protein [Methylococcaceae bacterium]|nr:acyl carrier protein [Prolixibacteraceae bacterium]
MTREEIFSRIETIAKKIFGENSPITEATTSADVEKWDSMNHVLLIANIEKEFRVTFDIMEIIGITSFGDFVDLIEKKQH